MPEFVHERAQRVYDRLAKPVSEPAHIAGFRKLFTDPPKGHSRQAVFDAAVRRADASDPANVTDLVRVVQEVEAQEAGGQHADAELEAEVAEALAPVDTRSPGEQVYDAAHDAGLDGGALDRVIESANRIDSQADQDDT